MGKFPFSSFLLGVPLLLGVFPPFGFVVCCFAMIVEEDCRIDMCAVALVVLIVRVDSFCALRGNVCVFLHDDESDFWGCVCVEC